LKLTEKYDQRHSIALIIFNDEYKKEKMNRRKIKKRIMMIWPYFLCLVCSVCLTFLTFNSEKEGKVTMSQRKT